jgi:hypothetical protein
MKYLTTLIAVCTIGLACTDEPTREAAPTGPAANAIPSASIALPRMSTVCLAYAGEQSRLETALSSAPSDARLAGQLKAIEAAIKDACT